MHFVVLVKGISIVYDSTTFKMYAQDKELVVYLWLTTIYMYTWQEPLPKISKTTQHD